MTKRRLALLAGLLPCVAGCSSPMGPPVDPCPHVPIPWTCEAPDTLWRAQ